MILMIQNPNVTSGTLLDLLRDFHEVTWRSLQSADVDTGHESSSNIVRCGFADAPSP